MTLVLRPVVDDDRTWIAAAAVGGHRSQRWSLRGQSPAPGIVEHLLGDRVAVQAVAAPGGGAGRALFQVVSVHGPTRSADLGVLVAPGDLGAVREAFDRFVERVLGDGQLDRLVLTVLNGHLDAGALVGTAPAVRLREHDWNDDGVLADLLVYELWPRVARDGPEAG